MSHALLNSGNAGWVITILPDQLTCLTGPRFKSSGIPIIGDILAQ